MPKGTVYIARNNPDDVVASARPAEKGMMVVGMELLFKSRGNERDKEIQRAKDEQHTHTN